MIGFCPLASGSKGNCIYVGTKHTKLLIDAGLSAKATRERLSCIGVSIDQIDAILVTHEHTDHIKGLDVLAGSLGIPVFCNSDTAKAIYSILNACPKFKIFSTGEPFHFGEIEICPFSIQHDAIDPVAFTMRMEGIKVGFCADLGVVTTYVIEHLKACDYLYIEANHEPSMVHACSRPSHYKQRVLGKQGHLSNEQCCQLIGQVGHTGLKHIHLAHISSECNSTELALEKAQNTLSGLQLQTSVSIAYQDQISLPIHFIPNPVGESL